MRLLVLLVVCCIATPIGASRAAEITHQEINDNELIIIDGPIAPRDLQTFRQISIKYDNALVVLDSDGGALLPAIEIGKIVKAAGYSTWVPADAICASACALIWAAGSTRWLSSEGRVGFHASYRDNKGLPEESSVANALIGSYLTVRLNLPQRTVAFVTMAPPDKILWLTKANAATAGIEFSEFEEGKGETQASASRIADAQISSLPAHLPARLSQTGESWVKYANNAYFDMQSVRSIPDQPGAKRVWILIDLSLKKGSISLDKEDQHRSRKTRKDHDEFKSNILYEIAIANLYCKEEKESVEKYLVHYTDGKEEYIAGYGKQYIVPGTGEKILYEKICG